MKLIFVSAILAVMVAMSSHIHADEDEQGWFFSDYEERIDEVSDGELEILLHAPQPLPHHHDDYLVVDTGSLETGWARLKQCHYQMDEISRAEVVFRGDPVRKLRILTSNGIEHAWVEKNSLQLKGISKGAQLCISVELKAVYPRQEGGYQVRMGPFMRRFLDGFYPLGVNLKVDFPCQSLHVHSILPEAQPGVRIQHQACSVNVHTWFKGQLILIVNLDETLPK